jgi:CheY-like chemotaxis protein
MAEKKAIELHRSIDPSIPPTLRGDSGRLLQVLTNLVNNAIKFTAEDGMVEVRIDLEQESESACVLQFSVRDSGIGIPADKVGTLFRKFSQVDSSNTRNYGGTGLGLAICKELTEMMGGEIQVESVEGKGAAFIFTLPFKKAENGGVASLPPAKGNDQGVSAGGSPVLCPARTHSVPNGSLTPRILMVEDNTTNQQVLLAMLLHQGFMADLAANGQEAVDVFKTRRYDLVFMDIQMPLMDGLQATRRIREAEAASGGFPVPIIAMTALAMAGDREKCIAAGMNDYLTKPLSPRLSPNNIGKMASRGG